MITATITPGGICIEAEVQVADHATATPVRFVVHRGSAITAIHPWDLAQMRLPSQILDDAPEVYINGIGGQATYRALPGTITFTGAYPDGTTAAWDYPVTLHIAAPTDYNETFPSILGRDVLYHWQHALAAGAGTMRFVPKGQPDARP